MTKAARTFEQVALNDNVDPAVGGASLGAWALGLVERLSVGLIVLSEARRLVFANPEALRILGSGDPLGIKEGRLVAPEPSHQREFAALFSERRAPGENSCVVLDTANDGKLVLLLEPEGVGATMGGACTLWLIDSRPGASRSAWLAGAFGLTPAEARVVDALANGLSTETAATTLDISIATLRTHLQRIYAKTGARTQGGLVRLALLRSIA